MSLSGVLVLWGFAFMIVSVLLILRFPDSGSVRNKVIACICVVCCFVIGTVLLFCDFTFLDQALEREVEIAQQEAQLAEYTATFEEFISEQFNGTIPNELLSFNNHVTTVSPTQDFYVLLRVWWQENTDLCYSRMVRYIRNRNIDLWQFITLSPATTPPLNDSGHEIGEIDRLIHAGLINKADMSDHNYTDSHPFYETDFDTVLNLMLNTDEAFILYVGFGDCSRCTNALPSIVRAAEAVGVPRILYVNKRSVLNHFPNEDNPWRPSDSEIALIDFLSSHMDFVTREELTRIFVPEVIVWSGDTVIGNMQGTFPNADEMDTTLTALQRLTLRAIYADLFTQYMEVQGLDVLPNSIPVWCDDRGAFVGSRNFLRTFAVSLVSPY